VKSLPATLIQVHYHDRLGGVNKVIAAYARAFEMAHAGKTHGNFVLCNRGKIHETTFEPATVIAVAECDYREFASKADFLKAKNTLVEAIGRLLDDPVIMRPLCVIGHNLTLGKNCALSAAFAQCASRYSSAETIGFYSVIHDLAEEGRADCLGRIEAVRNLGIDIWNRLYPKVGNVHFRMPNYRNALLLRKAGFHAHMLINPVEGPKKKGEASAFKKKVLKKSLLLLAKKDAARFDESLPILLYPCRCIARKNILEAILLTTFVCNANLLLGAPGNSPGDRALFVKTKKLCGKHRLPVVFDCGRVFNDTKTANGFSAGLYELADSCLSTSIAEGFGYALYEPWLYGKAVFGRRPLGFKFAAGVVCADLYTTLPIPAAWVCLSDLAAKYRASMRACFGHMKATARFLDANGFDREFKFYFVKNGVVDFGCLDATTQFAVLSDLLKSPAKVEEWKALCGKQLSAVREAFEKSMHPNNPVIHFNKLRVTKNLSMDAFSKKFMHYVNAAHPSVKPGSDFGMIAWEFCSFSKFRLLMTPGN